MPADRMPPLPDDQLTERQRQVVADIIAGPRGHLVGPFIPLMRSPEFMSRLQQTGAYLRFDSALSPRLSELAILITARVWTQQFEWHHHRIIGEKAGLSAAIIDAVAEGRRPDAMAADEAAIYDFLDELIRTRSVSDATYARTKAQFGERGVIDLIGLHGYYSLLAMVMNVARTPLPGSAEPALKPFPQ
jgi:4-carboxymuconolactone decarboxylase